jgi:hypothetical protein
MPQLGEHMSEVFPATLLILDDFDMDNKILGCLLMHHIVNNVVKLLIKIFSGKKKKKKKIPCHVIKTHL